MKPLVYTIGHGTKTSKELIQELTINGIKILIDVRSVPYSKYTPQHNREYSKRMLSLAGIDYQHIPALGGKYDSKPDTREWSRAIKDVKYLAETTKVAIMCSEQDPFKVCHRHFWIEPDLLEAGCNVTHIMKGGTLKSTPAPKPQQPSLL